MFAAGRLRERIKIRRLTDVPTGKGGYDRSWQTVAGMDSVPAEILSIGGREAMIERTLQGVATYTVRTRRRAGIQVEDQVVWLNNGGVELNIVSPPADPTGDREFLQFIADTSVQQNAGA